MGKETALSLAMLVSGSTRGPAGEDNMAGGLLAMNLSSAFLHHGFLLPTLIQGQLFRILIKSKQDPKTPPFQIDLNTSGTLHSHSC